LSPQGRRKTLAVSGHCLRKTRKTGQVLVRTPSAERPVISVAEIGYVRRSEIMSQNHRRDALAINPTKNSSLFEVP
jgi:hypothetical protein